MMNMNVNVMAKKLFGVKADPSIRIACYLKKRV